MSSRTEGCESGENVGIYFSRVCLRSDWIGVIKSRELRDEGIELFNFVIVAIEES